MSNAWEADIDIDAALAARLIAAQHPELRAKSVRPFGFGWDNAAFLVGEEIVFRFPRRRIAATLIEREIALLPLFSRALPLRISTPSRRGTPAPDYPWVFAGYDLIPGKTACSVSLSDDARARLAEPLGRFLRALHDVDPRPLVAHGLPPDELGRLDPQKRVDAIRERLLSVVSAGVDDAERFVAWLDANPVTPLKHEDLRVVHGDLYARHIVVDDAAIPHGVIDWGDLHLGDPALDLAIAHLLLPRAAHDEFRHAYGWIDERTWNAARYRAIYHAFLEINYAIHENDAALLRSGVAALDLMRT